MTRETYASPLTKVLESDSEKEVLSRWLDLQLKDEGRSKGISDASIRDNSNEFFKIFKNAVRGGRLSDISSADWDSSKQFLSELSASRALQGSSPSETARFVFSLKQPLMESLNKLGDLDSKVTAAIWEVSTLIDSLGLYTAEVFQKSREAIIRRQQKEMLEMSTPVIKMWDGILVVPLIGTLDSARTQIVMENLLQRVVETGSKVAILDITGVPMVDTQTAQHLIKTVAATRLMGADCIISGIRPQIAQTIVHLGIDIQDIVTKATMADAIKESLARTGWAVVQHQAHDDQPKKGERW